MEPASFIVLTQGNWEGLQNVPRKIRVIQNTLPVKNQNVVKWCSIQIFWSFTLASKNSRIFEIPLESALNLHGNSIEPPWNLHRSYNRAFSFVQDFVKSSLESASKLHGISMEPPWNLHQSDYRRNTFKTYLKTPWNLHQTSMKSENTCGEHRYIEKTPWNVHQNSIKTTWK